MTVSVLLVFDLPERTIAPWLDDAEGSVSLVEAEYK